MKSRKILLIGGGGHCHSVLDSLFRLGAYDEMGIIESGLCGKSQVLGVPIVGTDADLPQLFAQGWNNAVITIGSIGAPVIRRMLFQKLKKIGYSLPAVIDSSALIGCAAEIGEGSFIAKQAVINSCTHIGCCTIVNTGAILEHDCVIGDFAHIAPGCTLCGGVTVGKNTHIGAGSVIRQQIQIGNDSLIGAGSVVVSPIADQAKAFGNPCKVVAASWMSI